jgi:hypothetical protein
LACPQVRIGRPRHEQRTGQVDVDDLGEGGSTRRGDVPDTQHARRADDVVQAPETLRRADHVRLDCLRVADVEPGGGPYDGDAGTLSRGLVGDRPADPAGPTDDQQPRALHRVRRVRLRVRRECSHLDHPIRHDKIDASGDLDVDLVARDGADTRTGHVAKDEAAVVRGARVAGRLGGSVGIGKDAIPEDLGCLAATEASPIWDIHDHLVFDDDQRVGARDHRVGRVGKPAGDRLDGTPDDSERDEWPDGIVDDNDVVILGSDT